MNTSAALYDLGLGLLRDVKSVDGNSLVSPVSLARPLAVLAMGAKGATRRQIEQVLGASINGALARELKDLAESWSASSDTFSLADSLWINETFKPSRGFIDKAQANFAAEVFKRAFDRATLNEINAWVSENTHGMINAILDEISSAIGLYVINACAFEGQWNVPYERDDVEMAEFHSDDGTVTNVDMMYTHYAHGYLENGLCTGFMKKYADARYAFAGLLPKEGVSVEELLNGLKGAALANLLRMDSDDTVTSGLPKFTGSFKMDLVPTLKHLGVTEAFDPNRADFSRIGAGPMGEPLFVGQVAQRTFIDVDEKGTRASAATVFGMNVGSALPLHIEHHTVVLDRPFVYVIFDAYENVPLFMGTVGSIE